MKRSTRHVSTTRIVGATDLIRLDRSSVIEINGVRYDRLEDVPEQYRALIEDRDGNGVPDVIDEAMDDVRRDGFLSIDRLPIVGAAAAATESARTHPPSGSEPMRCAACGSDITGRAAGDRCAGCGMAILDSIEAEAQRRLHAEQREAREAERRVIDRAESPRAAPPPAPRHRNHDVFLLVGGVVVGAVLVGAIAAVLLIL